MESILDKVLFLLNKSKEHTCTKEEYDRILSYSKEHSDNMILGRVFGFSVSDYAIAALKWIGTPETILQYEVIYETLTDSRKRDVEELIKLEYYKQL